MSMTLEQLLKSTEKFQCTDGVNRYSPSYTFAYKEVGDIYFYNKTVIAKPRYSIVEITMMVKGKTEMVKKAGGLSTMAAHRVMIAIRGVRQRIVSAKQLANNMRFAYPKDYGDKEKFSDEELVKRAIEGKVKPFKHSTVIPLEKQSDKYVILQDDIPNDAIVRVWCSCSSYFWSFQYYNIKAGANILKSDYSKGSYGAYRYRTKAGYEAFKKGKPLRNPKQVPGMCKHLLLLVALLTQSKTIGESSKEVRKNLSKYQLHAHKFTSEEHISKEEYEKLMEDYKTDRTRQEEYRKKEFDRGLITMSQAWMGYNPTFGRRMH